MRNISVGYVAFGNDVKRTVPWNNVLVYAMNDEHIKGYNWVMNHGNSFVDVWQVNY